MKQPLPLRPVFQRTCLSIAVAACMSMPAHAVSISGANSTVNSLGAYLDDWLADADTFESEGGTLTEAESELRGLCNDYVSAARAVVEGEPDEVQEVIDLFLDVAHDEAGALGSGFSDTGQDLIDNVAGRLQALRAATPMVAGNSLLLGQTGGAAGDEFSRLGLYSNLSYGTGDKDSTRNERGFDFDSQAITFGADYRYQDNLIAGVALGLGMSDVDMDGTQKAESESDTISLTLYATTFKDDWYLDGSVSYAMHDYDNTRRVRLPIGAGGIDQTLDSSTDGDSLSLTVGFGLNQQYAEWTADYALRVEMVDATIDGYTESGGTLALKVGEQEVESLQAILAAQFSRAYSTENGVLVPSLGVEVHQEFDDESRIVTAQYALNRFGNQFSFTSDDADDTYFLLNAGASWVMSQGRHLFLNVDHIAGLDDVSSNTITTGFRMEL